MLLVAAQIIFVVHARPMRELDNNYFTAFVNCNLFFVILICLLSKLERDFAFSATFELGYDSSIVILALFLASLGVLGLGIILVIKDLKHDASIPVVKYKASGKQVSMMAIHPSKYHIFFSHSHEYGADQCAVIKSYLEQMVDGCRCFLDVDCFGENSVISLQALPGLVNASQNCVLYLTKGVFESQWIHVELKAVCASRCNPILVRETEERHGAMPVSQLREFCDIEMKERLFSAKMIHWMREVQFKYVSVIQIVQRMLNTQDKWSWSYQRPLYIPAMVTETKSGKLPLPTGCDTHISLIAGQAIIRSAQAALEQVITGISINVVAGWVDDDTLEAINKSGVVVVLCSPAAMKEEAVQDGLAHAIQANKMVVLLHDRPAGCPPLSDFKHIIANCPSKILMTGVMDELAVEWHQDTAHRQTSIHLAWDRIATKLHKQMEQENGPNKGYLPEQGGAKAALSQISQMEAEQENGAQEEELGLEPGRKNTKVVPCNDDGTADGTPGV